MIILTLARILTQQELFLDEFKYLQKGKYSFVALLDEQWVAKANSLPIALFSALIFECLAKLLNL
jgi:hypothetical protein